MPAQAPSTPTPPLPTVRRDFLERVTRALLLRLLAPHESALAAHGFLLSSLSTAAPDDRAPLHALFDLLDTDAPSASDPALLPLLTLLSNVCRVATTAGRDALIKLDSARVLPPRLGAEDLAATAALDYPALFASVRVASAADAIRGFVMYEPPPDREPSFGPPQIERTRELLARWFADRHRTGVCEIHVKHRAPEIHFEIGHGKTPQTHELIDEALARKIVTQVSTQRSYAFYNLETRVLAVHAMEFIKKGLRTCFGEGCGGDADFFAHATTLLDTTPLRDVDEALAPDVALGVEGVELQKLEVSFFDSAELFYTRGRDVRATSRRHRLNEALREEGARVSYLKMFVRIVGVRQPLLVEIHADRNQIHYDRRNAAVERALLGWLTARGIWCGSQRASSPPGPVAVSYPGVDGAPSSAMARA